MVMIGTRFLIEGGQILPSVPFCPPRYPIRAFYNSFPIRALCTVVFLSEPCVQQFFYQSLVYNSFSVMYCKAIDFITVQTLIQRSVQYRCQYSAKYQSTVYMHTVQRRMGGRERLYDCSVSLIEQQMASRAEQGGDTRSYQLFNERPLRSRPILHNSSFLFLILDFLFLFVFFFFLIFSFLLISSLLFLFPNFFFMVNYSKK